MNDLEKLFLNELKDVYDAEHQLVEALGEMEEAAVSNELKTAFHDHLEQTRNHVTRLEQVFKEINESPKRKTCKAIEGIIDEAQSIAKEFEENSALDAALIAAGQKAEHYEITTYGSLCAWAKELGLNGAVSVLKQNLSEEKAADEELTSLAESARNADAARHDTKQKSGIGAKISKTFGHGT